MTRFRFLIIAVSFLFVGSASAASGWQDYSQESFTQLQETGKTILVDVWADWCPTCKAQQPTLRELAGDERLKDVVFMRVDFDKDKGFLREHRIPRQSTIVIFNGKTETDRSIAETDRERLRRFVFEAVDR